MNQNSALALPFSSKQTSYVDLGRRFVDVDSDNFEVDTQRALLDELGASTTLDWDELLKSARVVILAEAGSGKTLEMQEQVKRLIALGQPAFFMPLQALSTEGLRDCLAMAPQDLLRFDQWLASDGEPAWLFLDAVDELKLTTTTLDQALGRVVRDAPSALGRLRVVISCRPWDWRPYDDRQTVLTRLPASELDPQPLPTGEEGFLAPLRENQNRPETKKEKAAPAMRIVVMSVLSSAQIRQFLGEQASGDPDELLNEIVRQDALPFARRPLDLKRLIVSWERRGNLGTHLQQHEDDVEHALKDRTNRLDKDLLPPSDAIEGAERLALAMALTKTRALQDVDSESFGAADGAALSPADVLHDWPASKIAALLRRAIFDPATYGRVQLHHRSVQEFLAARRLHKLRNVNLSDRELHRLLFADTYGEKVMIPAMRPIAAWLAIWRSDIASKILAREPEVLVKFGDPGSLSLEARRQLLRAFVEAYGGGGWRGLDMPNAEIRRLAHIDLADDIRHCWNSDVTNEEVRVFLMEIIGFGAINACADIAFAAAMNASLEPFTRTLAIRALVACNCTGNLRTIAKDMVAHPESWPDRAVIYGAVELYPVALSSAELLELIRRTPESRNSTQGFGWTLRYIIHELKPDNAEAAVLRNGLADEIMNNWQPESEPYHPVSKKSYLATGLAQLCAMELKAGVGGPELVRAAVIANRLNGSEAGGRDEYHEMREAIRARVDLRQMLALAELQLSTKLGAKEDAWGLYFYALAHGSLFTQFVATDWAWLIEAAAAAQGVTRGALLVALAEIWWLRGKTESDKEQLLALAHDEDTAKIVKQRTDTLPRKKTAEEKKWDRSAAKHKRDREKRQVKTEDSWRTWQREADADPESMFAVEKVKTSVNALIQWLGFSNSGSGLERSNWREVRRVLGEKIGDLFESAMREQWRTLKPPLRSKRKLDHNVLYHSQTVALTGISIEAATVADWAAGLNGDQAKLAAEWGTLDLNNLPEWYGQLAAAHPVVMQSVLLRELRSEIGDRATVAHPHVLSALQYGSEGLKELMASKIRQMVQVWPDPPETDELNGFYAENISRAMSILVSTATIDGEIARLCEQRFLADVKAPSALMWLRGIFAYQLETGVLALEKALANVSEEDQQVLSERWIASLFGDRWGRYPVRVAGEASELLKLVRLAYQHVAMAEDIHHEGVYSPGVRDNAQSARSALLGVLLDLPGKDAHRVLLAMCDDALFSHMPDRLRLMARERAAQDSDTAPFSASMFRDWENRYERMPKTANDLYLTMVDRLDDIERDVRHHPFNDRHVLKPIQSETAMQPLIAKKIEEAARGAYQVTREEEVADKKETDIRLFAGEAGKAVIEIKIGDRYSVRELEKAISEQLRDKYLRHPECRVGCLLVTYAGISGYKNPDTGGAMTFEDVIAHLRAYAAKLEEADSRDIKIGVVTLDLRDPLEATI